MQQPIIRDGAVTIVGASLAGLRCAETLRAEGFVGTISLVGGEHYLPYDRPPLTKQFLTGKWDVERLSLLSEEKSAQLGLDLRLGTWATGFDADAKRLELSTGDQVVSDAVVIATGAHLRHLPGTETMPGVHSVRTLDDAVRLKAAFEELEPASRVVFVGAGFIGQEVATYAATLGHSVTLLEGAALPLERIVGGTVAALLNNLHAGSGVDLRTNVTVDGISPARDGARAGVVRIAGAADVVADLIVVGIGVVPSTSWLEGSGLDIDNGVVTDERLLAAPGVLAAGDVARFRWLGAGRDELVRIEHWQMAVDHGVYAARVLLAGAQAAPVFDAVPYFWSDVWGKKIQVLGHPAATDDVVILQEPDAEGRLLAAFHNGSILTGVLGVSKPRQLMAFRPLLAAGATMNEALAVEI